MDGLYLLGSGRAQVIFVNDDGSEFVVNELGRGELIGEMALITDRPRSATIVAMRDSHLLFLSTEAFTRVIRAHPDALRAVSGAIIERLDAQLREGAKASPATSLVIVPLDASEHVRALGPRLSAALEPMIGSVRVAHASDMRAELGTQTSALDRAVWREQVEASHGAVIYVADSEFDTWADECVQHADHVLLAAAAGGPRVIRPIEHELARRFPPGVRRTELVLLHEPTVETPRGVRHWVRDRCRYRCRLRRHAPDGHGDRAIPDFFID